MAPQPGLLFVTMQPSPSLPLAQFHDWYNNEHGPLRLRLPFVRNGLRYRASDLTPDCPAAADRPEWLAMYDISEMDELGAPVYTRLRDADVKTEREKATMKQIAVDRQILELVEAWEGDGFEAVETVGGQAEQQGNALVVVSAKAAGSAEQEAALARWFQSEHGPRIAAMPGWRRTRQFVTSSLDGQHERTFVTIYEWSPSTAGRAVDGPMAEWRKLVERGLVASVAVRTYNLHLIFGAAPRHLGDIAEWTYTDGQTRTHPPPSPTAPFGSTIESYITTADGAVLPYRLEGAPSPTAPIILCINSILTTHRIWDAFVSAFFANPHNHRYRILRYDARGRSARCGSADPVTIDVLAGDAVALLDALRVPRAACVLGVSLGGITALTTALRRGERVRAFVSCDTNATAPAGNPAAWGERIAMAEGEGATAGSGGTVVGERLAEATVRRWFVKESYDGGAMEGEVERVKEMVRTNSLEGFKKGVKALYSYDVGEEMAKGTVPGLFVVGKGDGVLPGTMQKMADAYRWKCAADEEERGAELKIVDGAGHLPMVEKGGVVAGIVEEFLASIS